MTPGKKLATGATVVALGAFGGLAIGGCDDSDDAQDSIESVTEQINSVKSEAEGATKSIQEQTKSIQEQVPDTGSGNSGSGGSPGY